MNITFINKQTQNFKSWKWEKDNKKTKHKTEEIIAHRCRLVIEHLINNQPDQLIQAIRKLKEKNILIADKLLSSKAVNSLYQTILKTKDNSALGFLFEEFSDLPLTEEEIDTAIKNGNAPLFKLYIQMQKIYNLSEPELDFVYQECLNLAAQYKQPEIIKEIVQLSNKHKNHPLQSGLSLIDFAIENDQSDLLIDLLNRRATISSKTLEITKKKNNPIIFHKLYFYCKNNIQIRVDLINAAFHFKDQDKLIELLNSGLETYPPSNFLYNAAEKGLTELIVKCLELKPFTAVLNTKCGPDEWTPLHAATFNSHQDIALKLIEKGADPYAKDDEGYTPFYYAARNGLTKVIEKCLELNPSADLLNTKYGTNEWTPLHAATYMRHQDIALKLIEKGADPLATDSDRKTPFYYAAQKGLTEVIVKCLEHKSSDDVLNTKYGPGQKTPLHTATKGHEDIALKLIEKGADPLATDSGRNTSLHIATNKGFKEIALLLINNGALTNIMNSKGETPLDLLTKDNNWDLKDATEIDEKKYPVDYINIAHEHNNTRSNFFVHKEIAEKCEPIKKARKDYSSAKSIPLYGDFSHEVFKLYLQFLHTGEINITHDNFKDIAMAAHLVNSQEILKKLKDWVAGHPECENWKRHTEKPDDLAKQRYEITEVDPADKQEINSEATALKKVKLESDN